MEDIPGYRHLLALIAQDGNITHAIPLYTELYLEESQGISTKAAQPGTVLDFDKGEYRYGKSNAAGSS